MSHGSLGVPVHVPRYGTAGLCSRLPLVNKTTNRDRAGKGLVKGLALYVTGRPFQRASARRPVTGPEHPSYAATVPLSPGGSAAPQSGLAGRRGRGEDHLASLQGSTEYNLPCISDMSWSLLHGGPERSSATVAIEDGSFISTNRPCPRRWLQSRRQEVRTGFKWQFDAGGFRTLDEPRLMRRYVGQSIVLDSSHGASILSDG